MNKQLEKAWDEAERTGESIDIGRMVVCDVCSDDLTDSQESGGFIFSSTGYCPKCAPRGLQNIQRYGEERFIKATCPPGQSFADFIREYRGGNNTIRVMKLGDRP